MKTAICSTEFFSRVFRVLKGRILLQPSVPFGDKYVPTVSKTHSSLLPLEVTMQVFAELIHLGEDDPVGRDRLYVSLMLSIRPTFIRNLASESLSIECDSPDKVGEWLSTIKKAFLAANRFAILPRLSDETIELVFSPLFDTVAELHCRLNTSQKERIYLLENYAVTF